MTPRQEKDAASSSRLVAALQAEIDALGLGESELVARLTDRVNQVIADSPDSGLDGDVVSRDTAGRIAIAVLDEYWQTSARIGPS